MKNTKHLPASAGTLAHSMAQAAGHDRGRDLSVDPLRALDQVSAARLSGMRCGIEKESLRAQPGGALALTPHPAALGSALTHPSITTDFSESQVELVTGVHKTVEAALDELTQIHQFT